MLALQTRKKELENLIRNYNSSNIWLQQYTTVEKWKNEINRYKSMINDEITEKQKKHIELQIMSAQRTYNSLCSRLYDSLLHTIPKSDIEKELEEIKNKEMEYMNILLENAKKSYKKELQDKIESL